MTSHPDAEKYLANTAAVFADLERIPESERNTPGVCGDWTLKDLMGHLAFWDGHVANSLTAKRDGTERPRIREPHDVVNARGHEGRANWSWDQVMAEVTGNHERLLPLIIDPGEDPDYGIHGHWEEHGAQIASFADRVTTSVQEAHRG